MHKQEFLYHSSALLLNVLLPQEATGMGHEKDKRKGIYATQYQNCAIAFGLHILPVNGKGAWRLTFPHKDYNQPIIKIEYGILNKNGIGYLYTIPSDDFTQIDDWQWISTKAVIPIKCKIIEAKACISWIQYEKADMLS